MDNGTRNSDDVDNADGMEEVAVALISDLNFVGDADGHRVDLDAGIEEGGADAGARPEQVLLVALAGSAALAVIQLLRYRGQAVEGLVVLARGRRASVHPRVYTRIELIYQLQGRVDPTILESAIQLAEARYCAVAAMLGATAEIVSRYEIQELEH